MWMIAGQQFFRAAGYIFYSTWFPTYLKQTRNVTTKQSGLLSSLPLLAVIVGSLLGGMVVDWILARTGSRRLSRQLVAVLSMLSCAGFVGLAYFTSEAETTVLLISAGSFCAAFGGPCAYAVTIDMAGKHVPIVFSIMNMTGNLGAAACPLLVAWFVDATGKWDYVLFFFVGIYVAAAICWGLLNPQGSIFDRHRLPAGA
jgi:MFS family permease